MYNTSIPHLFQNAREAYLAKAFLEANGIESDLSDDLSVQSVEGHHSPGEIRMLVDEADYQTASGLLSENGYISPLEH